MSYNAFDPKLQLWVAACLYRYFVDQHEFLYGPLDDAAADAVYQDAKRLGTTLQVPENMWPADRVAFDEYWKRSLDELRIDPPVRRHLYGVASLAFLPWPLRAIGGPLNLFATTGFLPAGVPCAHAAAVDAGAAAPVRVAADGVCGWRTG